MNDRDDATRPGPRHDPDQETVSRLLAAAGGPTEVPDHVAARLDDVLADLVREREADPAVEADPAPVVELASRRRRWPRLLVAAAAVSVLGLGAGELLGGPGDTGRTVATSDSTAESADSAGSAGGPAAGPPSPEVASGEPLAAESPADAEAARDTASPGGAPQLHRDSLTADIERIAAFTALGALRDERARVDGACVRPRLAGGDDVLEVRLDGEPALLVMGAPEGGRRTAAVYTCDDGDTPAVETTVRAR